MTANRRTEVAVGLLFFVATASYVAGREFVTSAIKFPDYLMDLNSGQIKIGILLEFINCAAVVGIGVLLFPILRKFNEGMALGYAGTRIIESALLLASMLGPLLLLDLSQGYLQPGAADISQLEALGILAVEWRDLAFQMAMIALGSGSIMLIYILYKAKLVPRILSILGLAGYVALLASGWLEAFGHNTGSVLYIPGALFEIIFPLWIIIKGFDVWP